MKGRKVTGRVIESRYLQQLEKTSRKAPEADATTKTSRKVAEPGRRPGTGPARSAGGNSSRGAGSGAGGDTSRADKGDLQSTLLEGHGMALPELDLSAIKDKSLIRQIPQTPRTPRTPQLQRNVHQKSESSLSTSLRTGLDVSEVMEMVDSQALLLTLLTVKMENSLASFEEEAEKQLQTVGKEAERLRRQTQELRCRIQLGQRLRQLAAVLDEQIATLSPCEAVTQNFREKYQALAGALDATRHELPVRAIHLRSDGSGLLDDIQQELLTTHQLLRELGLDANPSPGQALGLLEDLRAATQTMDHQLQRSFAELLELSAEASKEVALANQEAWEETLSTEETQHCYFRGSWGATASKIPSAS
ncbi:HAUS augmin-like complex subunit 8 [Suncus etruscus]|uniref:HAUS augmin-like complex subunit 8 n=1 Tax=Suncus etruscus TaxID=109475 RepID=UPI00210FF495|nr:HAUS augmin-like complex subunit 8 [Suncus etruscus]